MKKVYGYGWRLSSESLQKAFDTNYALQYLNKTKADAIKDFKEQKEAGMISKTAKPVFFRVLLEDLESDTAKVRRINREKSLINQLNRLSNEMDS